MRRLLAVHNNFNVDGKMSKLVRDCIPQIIQESGRKPKYRRVFGEDEHLIYLKAKMVEEVNEFVENPCYEEAADILEVLKCFCRMHELEFDAVVGAAENKEEQRGGFDGGIILLGVEE